MKRISSYFNTPQSSRKRPSAAHNPQPESHSSTEGKTPHEEKKKCSRIFQPSWKQTYPWLKFTEGKMYCGTCLAERLANPTSAFVTGTENFRLDSIKSHGSSIPHVQATKASVFRLNPQQAPLPRALGAVSEEVRLKMEKLFAINGPSHGEYDATRAVAHWLASGERRRRPEYMDQNRRDAE